MANPNSSFSMTRRNFLKTASAIMAAAAAGRAISPSALAWAQSVVLDLYHDKSSWAPNVDKVGELAGQSIDIGFKSVPFPDHNRPIKPRSAPSLGSNSAPDLFTWWSGYRMEDLV